MARKMGGVFVELEELEKLHKGCVQPHTLQNGEIVSHCGACNRTEPYEGAGLTHFAECPIHKVR